MVIDIEKLKHLRHIDSGDRHFSPRDKIRATAARVGLGVPEVINYIMHHICLFSYSYIY